MSDPRLRTALVAAALLFLPLAGCNDALGETPTATATAAGEAGHDEHDHGDEVSDLDRPVEELFAESCEHGIKMFECDECRYEAGVVRVPADLVAGGLVRTAAVGARAPLEEVTLTGELAFDETRIVHLAPRVEGIIRAVHVGLGDEVAAGAPLLELDSVAFGEAQGAYLEARARHTLARRSFERQEALGREGITSERERLAARAEAQTADISVRAARERLLRLGLTSDELATLDGGALGSASGLIVLRAPRAGRVLRIHAVPGESVEAGEEILLVGDVTEMWVWADLYEDDLARVETHQASGPLRATVRVRAFADRTFPGTLDHLSADMDEATRTVKVRIAVPNPGAHLRAGMFADVTLALPGTGDAVRTVPATAVLADGGRSFVFVHAQGDYYVRRPVEPGASLGGELELRSGLRGDETIVTDGAFLLKSDVLRSKMGAGCAD